MLPRIQLALLAIIIIGTDLTMTDSGLPTTMSTFSPITTTTTSTSTQPNSPIVMLNSPPLPTLSSAPASNHKHLSLSVMPKNTADKTNAADTGATANNNNNNIPSSSSSFKSPAIYAEQQHKSLATDMNITVQIGNHAYLPCNVKSIAGKPVSWVRVRDGHILTVDLTLFIADERFQAIYHEASQKWSLQIKYSQPHDMGLYECQVSSEPKKSSRVFLHVVVPKTELIGDHNRFVKAGSKVALHCIVLGSIEPPSYIIWYKGNQQIIQDNNKGWYMQIDREIFGNSSDQQNTIGSLIIPSVTKRDSGNYTCSPSNSASVTVDLHVLNGEYSASAIMSSAIRNQFSISSMLLVILFGIMKFS